MSNSAKIAVLNGFDNPATIVLTHRFGSQPDETATWASVPFGEESNPPLVVHYETGTFSPWDGWHVEVTVSAGPNKGVWSNPGFKSCYLKDDDQGALLQFSVSPDGFKLNMVSPGCTDGLERSA
jgi:hypothetical protein